MEACDTSDICSLSDEQISSRASQPLSALEISLVEDTWRKAERLGAEKVGTVLFSIIFRLAPDMLDFYSFRKEPNVKLWNTPGFKAHVVKVVAVVGKAVAGLRNLNALVPELQALAIKHVGYGAKPEHYTVVGQALLETLEVGLGRANFSAPARLAWTKVWHIVSMTMNTAAATVPQPKKAPVIDMNGPLTTAEIKRIKDSWSSVEALGVEPVGVLLFKNIFELAPEAKDFYSFHDVDNLYESAQLKKHSSKVIGTVGVAVSKLDQLDELVPILTDLGKKHVGYGALPAHYDIVGKALLKTLEIGLGNLFCPEVKLSWTKVFGIVSKTMIGDNYTPDGKPRVPPEAPLTEAEVEAKAKEPLTSADVAVVQETWKKVEALGKEKVGSMLFIKMFDMDEEVLDLYPFHKEPDVKSRTTPGFKIHVLKVVEVLASAIHSLGDLENVVAPLLKELALKHVGYGAQPNHYDVVGKALMETLAIGLGRSFDNAARVGWAKVWLLVATTMKGAASAASKSSASATKSSKEASPGAAGGGGGGKAVGSSSGKAEKKADKRPAADKKPASAAAAPAPAAASSAAKPKHLAPPLNLDELKLVRDTWATAEKMGVQMVGVLLFRTIFELAPEAKKLYTFKDVADLYNSPQLKKHGAKVASTLAFAVSKIDKLSELEPALKELGQKHQSYGVIREHYEIVGQALVKTLKTTLGREFTPEVEAAWTKVADIVFLNMVADHYDKGV